ncbi:MAG: BspA family leucine-rich repeat surface protein, partial [Pseudomonadota bacterium]
DVITAYEDAARTHTYSSPGTYTITIYGQLYGWRFDNNGDRLKLGDISQWGNKFRFVSSGGAAPSSYALASSEGEIEALTVAGGYVWAGTNTAPGKLIRYNPTAGTHETTSLQAGEDYIYGMTSDGTSVYAVDWDVASNIIRFDAASGARIAAYPTGVGNLFSMTFDGTYVWAASSTKLVRFDPATTQLTVYDITGSPGAWSMVSVGDFIYGVSGTGLFRFNKTTLTTDTVTLTGASSARGIAFDGSNLWVTTDQAPMRLIKVNPSTLAFEVTTMPSGIDGSEGLIFDGTNLWSTMRYADVSSLLKIPVNDIGAATIATVSSTKSATQAIAFDGSKVWAASYTAPSSIFGIGKSYWPSDGYFYGCSNMSVSAADEPDMTGVTSMANAFRDCSNFNSDIGHWDVSGVEVFDNMFRGASSFSNGAGLRAEPIDRYPAADAARVSVSAGYYNGIRLNAVKGGSDSLYYYYHGRSTAWISNVSGKIMLTYGPDFPNLTRVRVSTTGTMPGGLATDTDYWIIRQQYAAWGDKRPAGLLAASLADAQAGIAMNYSTAGTGVLTVFDPTDSGWQVSSPHSQYWTKFYDDGTQMRPVTNSYWSVRWFYREISSTGSRLYYVSGTGEYATQAEAELEPQRTDLPSKITNECILVAKTVVLRHFQQDWTVSLQHAFSSLVSPSGYIGGTPSINNWNVSQAKSMTGMFMDSSTFNQPLSNWDVSRVTNFSNMFSAAYAFNNELTAWNTSNGILFGGMFENARFFNNGDPGNNGAKPLPWNVAKGSDFSEMFISANSFNQDITNWDMRNATTIYAMFAYSIFNNGDASNSQSKPLTWYLPKVVDANYIFYRSFHPFNQDIGSWFAPQNGDVMQVRDMTHGLCHRAADNGSIFNNGGSPNINNWRTPNLTTMLQMFANCFQFNQPIGNWDVSSVTNMDGALLGTSSFNQDLSSWNTGNVTNMSNLFSGATVFNNGESAGSSSRPLPWNVSKVTNFGIAGYQSGIFSLARSFNQDISSWDTSSATTMAWMFSNASSFNQDISSWNVSNVTNFSSMFSGAVSFKRNLSNWAPTAAAEFAGMFTTTDINTPGTTDNYDNFLLKVASVTNQNTKSLGGGSARYSFAGLGSAASSTGRAFLTTATNATPNAGRGWTISDGGSADCTFSSSSGLLVTYSGDRPTFSQVVFKTNGTLPTGLTAGTIYWTVRVSATTARLATSLANAQAGTVISFTDAGSGTHSVMNTGHVFTASNSSGNLLLTLTTGGDLNFSGRGVRFSTTGALPAGLSAGVDYKLNRVSATTYRVTLTTVAAVTGTSFITFTDSGTGTHELTLQ